MKEIDNEKFVLELCCDYLKSRDKKVAKYLTKKFNLDTLKDGAPKLEQIIAGHLNSPNKNVTPKVGKIFSSNKTIGALVKAPMKAKILKKDLPKKTFEKRSHNKGPPGLRCHNCNEVGHLAKECTNQKCFNCNKSGHKQTECKEEVNGNRFSTFQCRTCQEIGHISRNCPKKPMSCFNCGESGHIAKECRQEKVFKCRICHEDGHIARECSKNVCFKCNEKGHLARNCNNQNGNVGSFEGTVASQDSDREEAEDSSNEGD